MADNRASDLGSVLGQVLFLPPANEVCEGYVFTSVCQSFCSQGGSTWQVHPLGRYPQAGTPLGRYPPAGTPLLGRYTPPWAGTPKTGTPPGQVHPPLSSRYTPLGRYTHPPGQVPPWAGTHPPGQVHPPRQVHPPGSSACWEIRATSGWYVSYWNAFLCKFYFCWIV